MAMTILNNTSAALTLGELNKNVSALGKQLKKVANGEKITSAGDGTSEYVISERMRVRTRALMQDAANVQTGTSMLKVAEGAIQEQLEIMKTIKAKVIDANNDTNTDLDRVTIQKEISQGFEQVHDIAYETNYNGKLLLVGDKKVDEIYTWRILDHPEVVPDSDKYNFIENQYDMLDEQVGPFAVLTPYSTTKVTAEPLLGTETDVSLTGGDTGEAATATEFAFDFAGYTSANAEGVGFWMSTSADTNYPSNGIYYVLTNNPSGINYRHGNTYSEDVTEIDISGCDTSAKIAAKVAEAIKNNSVVGSTVSTDGSKVKATTVGVGAATNNVTVKGWSKAAGTGNKPSSTSNREYGRDAAVATGLGNKSASGTNAVYKDTSAVTEERYDPVTDTTYTVVIKEATHELVSAATPASMELDISSVASGTGFSICGTTTNSNDDNSVYVRLVDGSSITRNESTKGVYEIGKDADLSDYNLCLWSTTKPNDTRNSGFKLSISGGKLTLTTTGKGSTARINVTDGFSSKPAKDPVTTPAETVPFAEVKAYTGSAEVITAGKDRVYGPEATYDINLNAYDTTDSDKLEEFIDALKGKAIVTKGDKREFIDTKVPSSLDAMQHLDSSQGYKAVDLNALRTKVAGGKTIAESFIEIMKDPESAYKPHGASYATYPNRDWSNLRNAYVDASDANNKILRVTAQYRTEKSGNNTTVSLIQGNMSSYTIDFKSFLANNGGVSIPGDLDGKGFRLYCATCADQWFNFQFKSKDDPSDIDRPASGQSGADLKTTIIDISKAHDVKSLVQALYDQGSDALEHIMDGQPHTLHFAADPEAGTLTVYDKRMYDLRASGKHRNVQEMGAKLADGVLDDVQKSTRGVFVKDLVIHHTDKASMNIHIQIPQTSMDHLFNYIPEISDWTDYNVLNQANREKLLGNQAGRISPDGSRMVKKDEQGLLDRAIQYLTDANTLVGAQTSRLEMTHDNIITQQESTTASESTIRDADMAKEMTEYTKANVLTQAAQSMLAQANQNSSSVLSLLQ